MKNFAINALRGTTCSQDIELRRNGENFLNALGADAIPDEDSCAAARTSAERIANDLSVTIALTCACFVLEANRHLAERSIGEREVTREPFDLSTQ